MIRIDTSFANAIKVGNDYYPLNTYLTASAYLTTGVTITDRTLGRIIAKGIPFGDYVDAGTGLPLGATQAATITALQTAFSAVGNSGIDVQNLDDVTLSSLVSNQVLAYNSGIGQWVNVDLPANPAVEDNAGTPVLASGITQAEMQSVLNVDPAGTDNSTDATVGATASDVLKMAAGQSLGAFDAGADKLVFWDDSDSKLTYATIGTNLTMTGTTLSAAGGGANNVDLPFSFFDTTVRSVYIPIKGETENAFPQRFNKYVPAYDGSLVKVTLFGTSNLSGGTGVSVTIRKQTTANTFVDQETQTSSTLTAYSSTILTFSSNSFVAGDVLTFWIDNGFTSSFGNITGSLFFEVS